MVAKKRGPYGIPWAPAVTARIVDLHDRRHTLASIRQDLERSFEGREKYPRSDRAIRRVIEAKRPQDRPAEDVVAEIEGEGEAVPEWFRAYYFGTWRMLNADPDEVEAVVPVLGDLLAQYDETDRRRHTFRISPAEAAAIHRVRTAYPDAKAQLVWALARELSSPFHWQGEGDAIYVQNAIAEGSLFITPYPPAPWSNRDADSQVDSLVAGKEGITADDHGRD